MTWNWTDGIPCTWFEAKKIKFQNYCLCQYLFADIHNLSIQHPYLHPNMYPNPRKIFVFRHLSNQNAQSHPWKVSTADLGIAFHCISNHLTIGEFILAQLTSLRALVVNVTQPSHTKRALGLLMVGTLGLATSWGEFTYHETTLRNLT